VRKITFPIEFISPYSPNECVIRLEAKRGDYSGTVVNVDLVALDGDQHQFHVQMNNIRGRSPHFIDAGAVGWFQAREDSGTRIVIEEVHMGFWNYTYAALLFIIAAVLSIVIMTSGFPNNLLPIPWIIAGVPIIASLTSFLWWHGMYSATLDKLMILIEETLVYYSGQKSKRKRD